MTQPLLPVYPADQRRGLDGLEILTDSGIMRVAVTRFQSTDRIETGQVGNIAAGLPSLVTGTNSLRRVLTLRNQGVVDIYIGSGGVTVTTGYRLGVGESLTLETAGNVYAVTPSGVGTLHWLAEIEEPI